MARVVLWAIALLAVAGLAWALLGDADVGSGAPSFDPLGEIPESIDDELGPGLKVRAGVRMLEEETESGDAGLRGIVLDERGHPLAGVTVTATPAPRAATAPGSNPLRTYFEPPTPPGRVQATAVTDASGLFLLDGLAVERPYRVQARVAPPRYSSRRRQNASHALYKLMTLTVGEGAPFRGRVVDGAGAGLRAWVSAYANNRLGLPRWLYRYWAVSSFQTKADGRFELAAVPNGELGFSVNVLGRGRRDNIRIETPAEGEVEIPFEPATGATVTGRVTDTSGRAVGGAQIVISARHVLGGRQRDRVTRTAVTDASGMYAVERLTPGEIGSISVHAEGFMPPANLAASRLLEEGRPTRVDIVLARGGVIAGRVLDTAGAPIVGAEVSLGRRQGSWNPAASTSIKVTSGSDGRYELARVPLGAGAVVVMALGYFLPSDENAPAGPPWMQAQPGRVYEMTEEGERIELDLQLEPGTPVAGVVTTEDGSPVAAARVELRLQNNRQSPGFPGRRGMLTAISAEDGRFAFPGVAPTGYQVKAMSSTHISEWVKFALPQSDGKGDIEVVVKEGATVAGRATTSEGSAVAGMTVTVAGALGNAVTAVDGTYMLGGIPAGEKKVRASVSPRPPSAEKKISFEWGQRRDGVDLVIPPTFAIRGVVIDGEGKPVEGARVSAKRRGKKRRSSSSAPTRAGGAFELVHLEEGDYDLYAGGTKHDRSVASGATDVRLTYVHPESKRAEGRVEDAEGNSVASGQVRVWYGKDGKRTGSHTANISAGYFRSRNDIKYEAVDLEVTSAFDAAGRALNFLPERVKDVELGAKEPVVLKLSPGLEIRGRVEDAGGAPVAGITVTAAKKGQRTRWPGQRGTKSARSREDGSFRLIGLKDEEAMVNAAPGGRWVTPDPVPARPGDTDVVIRLSKGGAVTGRVLTVDGEPIPGARVWLSETEASRASRGVAKQPRNQMAQFRHQRTCESDGSFEVQGLPDDALFNVTGSVQKREQAFVSETIRDVATGSLDVLVQLREGVMIKGTIEGPEGETIKSGWLRAQPLTKGMKSATGTLNRTTGSFSVGPLQAGRYKLTVRVYGNVWASPAPIEVDAPTDGLRVVVKRARKVQGTLRGADVKGFRVIFSVKGRSTNGNVRENGAFTISGAATGVGKLFAHKPGDSRYALLEGVDAEVGPFTLTLQEGLSISGRVQGLPEGSKGGQIWAMQDGYWIQGSFRGTGDFDLTGLPPGEYQISGWMSGGRVVSEGKVQAGATGVSLDFKPKGSR